MIAESVEPGAKLSQVAKRHGVPSGLLRVWLRLAERRREAAAGSGPIFVPVTIDPRPSAIDDAALAASQAASQEDVSAARSLGSDVCCGVIEIDLPGGRVRLNGAVAPTLARVVIAAVRARV